MAQVGTRLGWPVRYRDDYWIDKMREQMREGRYWSLNLPGCFLIVLLFAAIIGIGLFQSCAFR